MGAPLPSLTRPLPGGSAAPGQSDTRVMAKALAGLFAAGATLTASTVILPHPGDAKLWGLLAVIANAYAVAAVLFYRGERMPQWAIGAFLAAGTVHITAVAGFSAERPGPLVFFYLWVFLFSAYFFSRRRAAVQIAFAGVNFGALLVGSPPSSGPVAWWLVGMGAMLVAAVLIGVMRERAELLIGRLHDAARTDPLTQILNRRGFRELLDLELERARRGGTSLAVVTGDIDRFKEVNDRLGHHAGDRALRRAAGVLGQVKRQIDAAARVGGEEFALVLPDTDPEGARVLAERLRGDFEAEFAGDPVAITMSFGVAVYPDSAHTAGSILRAADEAVYAAKQAGRNRTVVHTHELRDAGPDRSSNRDLEAERYMAIVLELAEAADLRFSGSARHSETVGRYAEMMARELGLSEQRIDRIRLAGVLHDVGKVGVPDAILRKPGKLDEAEWAKIAEHPALGAQILEHPGLMDVRQWVGAHHERPDGRGYPLGLTADQISLEPAILAVADSYEAMTSDRSYRSAMSHAEARDELRRCAGAQFDPAVVEAFLAVLERDAVPVPPAAAGAAK